MVPAETFRLDVSGWFGRNEYLTNGQEPGPVRARMAPAR
jgi:hypothetical protein